MVRMLISFVERTLWDFKIHKSFPFFWEAESFLWDSEVNLDEFNGNIKSVYDLLKIID